MIDLYRQDYLGEETEPVYEGLINDALKSAGDVDTQAIKDTWKDADKGIVDKVKIVNDKGIQPAARNADRANNVLKRNQVNTASIVTRAKNSILQFPIYVTQTIRVNEAHIIAGLFERVYATLVQTVLSQNQIMDEDDANNLVFLKRFHTNLKEAADVLVNMYYEPIDEIDRMLKESVFFRQQLTDELTVEFSVVPTTDEDLILENARLMNEPLTGFAYLTEANSPAQDTALKSAGRLVNVKNTEAEARYVDMSEEELQDMARDKCKLNTEERRLLDMTSADIERYVNARVHEPTDREPVEPQEPRQPNGRAAGNAYQQWQQRHQQWQTDHAAWQRDHDDWERRVRQARDDRNNEVDRMVVRQQQLKERVLKQTKKLKKGIKDGEFKDYVFKDGKYRKIAKNSKTSTRWQELKAKPVDTAVDAPKLLRDTDIKKINGMLPYSIEATFRLRTKSGIDRDIRYVLGIKSVMHLIRPADLKDELRDLISGKMKSLQKVRYKTGEISFRDYFFNIKGLKADAAKHINYNKRWINTLKRLADYRDMNHSILKAPVELINKGDVPIPNGTLILAQPDVTMLTQETGIDLSNVGDAKRLAKNLFLIAIAIVDSSAGTMRVLFPDQDTDWDVQSLGAIDAELAKTDNSQLMRELNHMVNRSANR